MSYALAGGGGHHPGGGHRGGGHRGGGGGFRRGGWGGGWDRDYGPGLIVVQDDSNPCARPELYPTPLAAMRACAAYQAQTQLVGMGDMASLTADFKAGGWKWALGGVAAALVLRHFV